jgi:hypothetical protein
MIGHFGGDQAALRKAVRSLGLPSQRWDALCWMKSPTPFQRMSALSEPIGSWQAKEKVIANMQ